MSNASVSVPILINCRDRVSSLLDLVSWLERAGHEHIVMVDNNSSYEPLLDYYEVTPHQVVRLGANVGPHAVWDAGLLESVAPDDSYVVTDCDILPDSEAPLDAVAWFAELLARYPEVEKVGFGLRLDDVPRSYRFYAEVHAWEAQFWANEVEPGVFRADIDTTFALYRPSVRSHGYRALRTAVPYVARHLPWYVDSVQKSDEEAYYQRHAMPGMTNWSAQELPINLRNTIEAIRSGSPG